MTQIRQTANWGPGVLVFPPPPPLQYFPTSLGLATISDTNYGRVYPSI